MEWDMATEIGQLRPSNLQPKNCVSNSNEYDI